MNRSFNPYFIGLPILIFTFSSTNVQEQCFNPYFIGLPILISSESPTDSRAFRYVSILILLDYLFLSSLNICIGIDAVVSILILLDYLFLYRRRTPVRVNPALFQSLFYWITYSYNRTSQHSYDPSQVSILILLDYLFLYRFSSIENFRRVLCFNPYFIGLPILILINTRSVSFGG